MAETGVGLRLAGFGNQHRESRPFHARALLPANDPIPLKKSGLTTQWPTFGNNESD